MIELVVDLFQSSAYKNADGCYCIGEAFPQFIQWSQMNETSNRWKGYFVKTPSKLFEVLGSEHRNHDNLDELEESEASSDPGHYE